MDIMVYISGDKIGMFYALGSMATSGWIPRDGYIQALSMIWRLSWQNSTRTGESLYIYIYIYRMSIYWLVLKHMQGYEQGIRPTVIKYHYV